MLIGPNVINKGDISTPDGQTILAAGLQVGIEASSQPQLRGLDVYIGAVSDSANPIAGTAENDGLISVPSGDAYMVGKTINQMGVIASTTSVTLNGEIDLLADYGALGAGGTNNQNPFADQDTGSVEFGPDSLTDILPELDSDKTVALSSFKLTSEVNVQGESIDMAPNSTLAAPSATINMNAGVWDYHDVSHDQFVSSAGQIYLDKGAMIDAAGSADVQASVDQNIISLQLLGPELADSPSQRDGVLAGQTIYVDVRDTGVYSSGPEAGEEWIETPLVDDAYAFAALIPYTIGELTINGGKVNMSAGTSVVMQPGFPGQRLRRVY